MINYVIVLCLALSGSLAFARDHEDFPEGTLLALEGRDAISNQECGLFIMDVGFTGPEQTVDQWYAKVLTSYSHNEAAPAPITVKVHPAKPGAIGGTGANGKDQIAIFLAPTDLDLRNAKTYNLKWLHGDHFHTNRCVNLLVHED